MKNIDFDIADPKYEMKPDGWFNLKTVGLKVKVKARES